MKKNLYFWLIFRAKFNLIVGQNDNFENRRYISHVLILLFLILYIMENKWNEKVLVILNLLNTLQVTIQIYYKNLEIVEIIKK